MKKFIAISLLAFTVLFAGSCANDLDTNADWKEIMVVYGLLNVNDTDHYVRVNRAFLSENQSALEIAKISDSLYFDSLEVTVEEFSGNSMRQSFRLTKFYVGKDTGIFATEGSYVYTFKQKLDMAYKYRLVIYNKLSKKYTTAETVLIGNPTLSSPSNFTTNYIIDTAKNLNLSWTAAPNTKLYDLTLRFYWNEYDSASNQLLSSDNFIDWPILQGKDVPVSGSMRSNIPGIGFYHFLSENLTAINGKYRVPQRFDFMYWAADKEYYLYRSVNQPSVGLVQKKPEYTNISSGNYGLFASRNLYTIKGVSISQQTVVSLQVNTLTRKLKFRP
ncbi:MAG: DUF4249 family protein [Bacteroidetes bacterium]|nr:MAG: DUF4249 family protein [Bacteroidota bacterium]